MPKTAMLAILSILLVGSIILQPDASFQASLRGLTVWWDIVFPGLLPFLVLYEMMLAFGLAHALGALLQPAASRMLRLPGEAALTLVIGWLGGYPAGAEAVASLRKRELVNESQGQLLLGNVHMPNPLFMLVIIGAGFLQKPLAGMLIAAAVWLSALWLLLLSSLFAPSAGKSSSPMDVGAAERTGLLRSAARAMRDGRERDGRSFGRVLGDSVSASVQRLMMIGGFMIFASVLAKLTEPLFAPLAKLGVPFLGAAFFEGHLGAYAASAWQSPGAGLALVCAAIAAVLAWSGLSGILQAGYAVSGTGLKLWPFVLHRLNHAVHAFLVTLLLWGPLGSLLRKLWPDGGFPVLAGGQRVLSPFGPGTSALSLDAGQLPSLWLYSTAAFAAIALLLGALALTLRRIRIWRS